MRVYGAIMKTNIVSILKKDDAQQIVYGEVYLPMVPDSDGDFMTAESIQEAAYSFMKKLRGQRIDVNHDNSVVDAGVVESFIARDGDPTFVPGAWVVGVHIEDSDVWDKVVKGELNGFSMQGVGVSSEVELEFEVPEFVVGRTAIADDHEHEFIVKFDDQGTFMGGWTDDSAGHKHAIVRGTATEFAEGHNHRFVFAGVQLNAGT